MFIVFSSCKVKVLVALLFSVSLSVNAIDTLSLAVGHDHKKMVKKYPFYAASWQILNEELFKLGYQVQANAYPWARAKESVRQGKNHGLFLAAAFKGRDEWAHLSNPIGQDQFGLFYQEQGNRNAPIGTVRLKSRSGQLSYLDPAKQVQVATAQEGLKLLSKQKLSAFVMSRSYGEYLLDTELSSFKAGMKFDEESAEVYTAHIAIGKEHPESQQAYQLINQAIKNAIDSGRYIQLMKAHKAATYQLIK